jgi:hypothetical protein
MFAAQRGGPSSDWAAATATGKATIAAAIAKRIISPIPPMHVTAVHRLHGL